ncbi:MAG: tyrosine-type recombinase/integrase [Acidobacteriota bacterium]
MSKLAPTMEGFFTERLIAQRRASRHTVASYRDTFRLLMAFAREKTGKAPSKLEIEDLDAELIGAFLEHLEVERRNSVRTRNNRLAAIRSLFAYGALRHPDHAALIQRVLAIPAKRMDRRLVSFLNEKEVKALLDAPDRETWVGRRDHALLVVAIQTGLRVSELTALVCADVDLKTSAHLRCHGKGRKERITPLTRQTCGILRSWLAERQGEPYRPLFPSRRNGALSRDAVALLVAKHARAATQHCPSLGTKTVTPHVLRHTCAMQLLTAGVDSSVSALWLGHESVETTQIYLHADLGIKERALARIAPPDARPGRYRPPDPLLAFLEAL